MEDRPMNEQPENSHLLQRMVPAEVGRDVCPNCGYAANPKWSKNQNYETVTHEDEHAYPPNGPTWYEATRGLLPSQQNMPDNFVNELRRFAEYLAVDGQNPKSLLAMKAADIVARSHSDNQAATENRDWFDSLVNDLSASLKCSPNASAVIISARATVAKVAGLEEELTRCQVSLPLSTNRTREQARRMLGEVLRHGEGVNARASHGCVEAVNAIKVVDMLIGDRESLAVENEKMKGWLTE
jgi:hypothetical protein